MPQQFGPHATIDEVLGATDLSARTILITGAASGLGLESARAFAKRGARLMLTVRDAPKAAAAIDSVKALAPDPAAIEVSELDLAAFSSIRAATTSWLDEGRRFNILMANAGVMACPEGRTQDGFETQFGTNHLGHFLLVNRLVPTLIAAAPSRVVILSSGAHRRGEVSLDDPNFAHTPYSPWLAYGRSKTANALFAVALDARLKDKGVRACSISPGAVSETNLSRHMTPQDMERLRKSPGRRPVFKTLAEGAATQVWAAAIAQAETIGGRYCENCAVADTITDPVETNGVMAFATDPARAEALWAASEGFVGERFAWP
ncbi:MAG TPA: SDR family NAD(P)-dependent oxidoreductase [Rhizomicrobium sp.]|nr:SDR family NAD(P)-dependent oxidoreductase [Rhizomicrobium sp.]